MHSGIHCRLETVILDDHEGICAEPEPEPEPEPVLHVLSISSITSNISLADLGAEEPLTLPSTVDHQFPASLLIDSGASSQFVDIDFWERHGIALKPKPSPESLILTNGEASPVGKITHTCSLYLRTDLHHELLTFQVIKLGGWDLVVGKPWLRLHNPLIDWTDNTITLCSDYRQARCVQERDAQGLYAPAGRPRAPKRASASRRALQVPRISMFS